MKITLLRTAAVAAILVATVSGVHALRPQAATPVAPLIDLASLPPQPTPLPSLDLGRRNLLVPGDTNDGVLADGATSAPDGTIAVSEGTLGVVLAGENSQATVLTSQGPKFVHIGSDLDGKTVVQISIQGVRLSDGRLIGRGLGVTGTNTTQYVPGITATEPPAALQNGAPQQQPRAPFQQGAQPGSPGQAGQPPFSPQAQPTTAPWSMPSGPSMGTQTGGYPTPTPVQQLNPFNLPSPVPMSSGGP
jgi:hypothetical protein